MVSGSSIRLVFKKRWTYLTIALIALTLGSLIVKFNLASASAESVAVDIGNYIEKNNQNFVATVLGISKLETVKNAVDKEKFLSIAKEKKYFLFQYKNISTPRLALTDWSSSATLPTDSVIVSKDSIGYANLANGHYVFFKKVFTDKIIVALLPIKWNYFVTNTYLKNEFSIGQKSWANNFDISIGKANGIIVKATNNKELFQITKLNSGSRSSFYFLSYLCFLIGLVFLLLYMVKGFTHSLQENRKLEAILVFCFQLLFIKIAIVSIQRLLLLNETVLFSSLHTAKLAFSSSLGDWFINTMLAVFALEALRRTLVNSSLDLRVLNKPRNFLTIIISATAIVLVSFCIVQLIKYVVTSEVLSFDVLNIFSLDYLTVVALVGIIGSVYVIFQINYYLIIKYKLDSLGKLLFLLSSTILLLLIVTIRFRLMQVGTDMAIACWLLGLQILIFITIQFKSRRSVFLLGWMFFLSISTASFILHFQQKKELEERSLYANRLAAKVSPVTEMMLGTISTEINNGFTAEEFLTLKNSKSRNLDSVKLSTSYSNRYSYKMFLFDENEKPLQDNKDYSFADLNTIILTQAKPSLIPDLYVYEASSYQFNFILKKQMLDTASNLIGYAIFQIVPRTNVNSNLYPEIFNKQISRDFTKLRNYAFAIYNNDKIIYNENEFPFSTSLPSNFFKLQQEKIIDEDGYSQLWKTTGAGKAVAIVKKNNTWLSFITLFSYILCIMLLLRSFWILARFIGSSTFSIFSFFQKISFNIAERIQASIILLSVGSFFIIGIVTILFFISRSRETNQKKLSNTLDVVINQLEAALDDEIATGNLYDSTYSRLDSSSIYRIFSGISESNGIELNLYDLNANLQFSTLPLPYSKELTSKKMDPNAFVKLNSRKALQLYQNEKIGQLNYLSAYRALINGNGDTYGFIQSPFFRSEVALRNDISDFLVAMINLIVFIFLISGLVAILVTNRITNAFTLIGNKMKMISLGRSNQAIDWVGNDEIGILIQRYNAMISELEASAATLAKKEREYAWQEMAKQVAHEIKNPLTPMKLSIQFLQRAIESNAPNVKELSTATATTIINQIEHLSRMAGEFSQFAQIGSAKKNKVQLQNILFSLKELYKASTGAKFSWEIEEHPIFVLSDETNINRLFTNLIQNAIQSSQEEFDVNVSIKLFLEGDNAIALVQDSGSGIPEDLIPKIFVPNFTTKTSGTGLGLAMCKRIAEQAGGDISFTSSYEGTIFKVSLPVIN